MTHYAPRKFSASRLIADCLLGCCGKGRYFAVPSAGKLYPYELRVVRYHGDRVSGAETVSVTTLISFLERLASHEPTALGIDIIYAPGISMRKYGERGYVYGLQDCGHLIANIIVGAAESGLVCSLDYAPIRDPALQSGRQWETSRVCTIRIDFADPGGYGSGSELREVAGSSDLLRLMASRRSATSFSDTPVPATTIEEVTIAAMRLARRVRPCSDTDTLTIDVATRSSGWWVRRLGEEGSEAVFSPPRRAEGLCPVALFMNQRFVEQAQAIILISASAMNPLWQPASNIRAGQLGQCFYISALERDLGICCVGGFDCGEASRVFSLPHGMQPVYAMVLGRRGAHQEKEDRVYRVAFRGLQHDRRSDKEFSHA